MRDGTLIVRMDVGSSGAVMPADYCRIWDVDLNCLGALMKNQEQLKLGNLIGLVTPFDIFSLDQI